MAAIRCFIAVELDPALKDALQRPIESLRRIGGDVRWVKPDRMHLTLRFLGEIPEEQVEAVRTGLVPAVRGTPAISLKLQGIGRFPEKGRRARVIWVGCAGDRNVLKGLWEKVQACARSAGLPRDDHGFSPHITLGRVKSGKYMSELLDGIAKLQGCEFGEQTVDRVSLIKSDLKPTGPVYTLIESAGF